MKAFKTQLWAKPASMSGLYAFTQFINNLAGSQEGF